MTSEDFFAMQRRVEYKKGVMSIETPCPHITRTEIPSISRDTLCSACQTLAVFTCNELAGVEI